MNKYYIGIDLHSDNLVMAKVDQKGARKFRDKLPCDLEEIVRVIKRHRRNLELIVVESTYNWYWLIDGLRDEGLPVALANPAGIQQYDGLKHTDDVDDAYWLAEMARLGILPTGYLYDPQLRSVRDLLRRRLFLVRQRTSLILSFKGHYARTLGGSLSVDKLKKMAIEEAEELFWRKEDKLSARAQITLIGHYEEQIAQIEKAVFKEVKKGRYYQGLQSLPGVGRILGMTMALETGEIERFKGPGNYASYCRTVSSRRLSNQKVKGRGNRKCGNKYLAWAFVEAAHCAKRYDGQAKRFFERKKRQRNTSVATKALACKLAKAAWWVMAQDESYDPRRMWSD